MNTTKTPTGSDDDLVFPEVQNSLLTAVRARQAAAPTSVRRRGRFSRRTSVSIFATVGVLLGGTALAATTPWSPTLGDERRGHPSTATSPIPADQTAALGALRRPQNDEDRGPRVQAMLRILPAEDTAGVHLDSVRLLTSAPQGATFLFAAERTGTAQPGYPSDVQHDVLCFVSSEEHHRVNGTSVGPDYGTHCGPASEIAAGRMIRGALWAGKLGVAGLVPDGVTRVEVPLTGGPTITAKVVNNAFLIDTDAPRGTFDRNNIRMLDSDGTAIPRTR